MGRTSYNDYDRIAAVSLGRYARMMPNRGLNYLCNEHHLLHCL
jgi:hypothetical protein